MIYIAKANGRGTCKSCGKPITKGSKQIVVTLGSGSDTHPCRICKKCSLQILTELTKEK